jgi:SAM-dependent methyltransferase
MTTVTEHELKQLHRLMWGLGDYPRIADLLAPPCVELVRRLEIAPGLRLADIACGTGNVAIPAARLGAQVTGVDLTPEHFNAARERAAEAGVDIDWIEGDAEALDLPDSAFDRVTSTFGAQFAPRHQPVADELARICKSGGVIGMCNWTERGWAGQFQRILATYFPEPQDFQDPAMLWGDVDYVRHLFERLEATVTCRLSSVPYEFPSAEHLVRFFETNFGPFIAARAAISPHSRWAELRAELVEMTESCNVLDSADRLLVEAEYLEVIISKGSGDG